MHKLLLFCAYKISVNSLRTFGYIMGLTSMVFTDILISMVFTQVCSFVPLSSRSPSPAVFFPHFYVQQERHAVSEKRLSSMRSSFSMICKWWKPWRKSLAAVSHYRSVRACGRSGRLSSNFDHQSARAVDWLPSVVYQPERSFILVLYRQMNYLTFISFFVFTSSSSRSQHLVLRVL